MKIHFGEITAPENVSVSSDWQRISSPSYRSSILLAGFVGLMVPFVLVLWLTALSILAVGNATSSTSATPWGAIALAIFLFIPLHELLHAVAHSHFGLSEQTILVLWPAKLRIGVYYDGCMTRRRWLFMRIAPFIGLSILPIALLTLFRFVLVPYPLLIFLQVMMLLNGIGSGGDLIALLWVMKQVPAKAAICFKGGLAFWHLPTAQLNGKHLQGKRGG